MKLSVKIKALLEEKQISQAELAERAELDATSLSRILKQDRDWRVEHILAVSRVLEENAVELIRGTEEASVLKDWVPTKQYLQLDKLYADGQADLAVLRAKFEAQQAEIVHLAKRVEDLSSELEKKAPLAERTKLAEMKAAAAERNHEKVKAAVVRLGEENTRLDKALREATAAERRLRHQVSVLDADIAKASKTNPAEIALVSAVLGGLGTLLLASISEENNKK